MPSLYARLVVAAALALAGCTHSRPLDTASPESRTHVNARAEGESARITLHGGEEVRARGLHVAPDETTWLDPDTGEMRSVPTSELASVRFTDRGRGVLEGLGLGTAIGAGLGVLVGTALGANDEGLLTRTEWTLLIGSMFGGAGAIIGGIAGLDGGSRTVYAPPATARDD